MIQKNYNKKNSLKDKLQLNHIFNIKYIDHYAVIVRDIEAPKQFYINCLGFSLVNSYTLQTSNESNGDDTLSVVLSNKNNFAKEICVLNQPLNEFSFLNLYIDKYGEGIHHIAFAVDDIKQEFEKGIKHNINFTSKEIVLDYNNNLKQVFIDRKYTGHFIELVERDNNDTQKKYNVFSQKNIKELIISTTKNL